MVPTRSSKAVVVIVGLWVLACAAALALATTSDQAAAQGCRGGSPSPSNSASASQSPSESGLPIPVSLPPVPAPDGDAKEAAEPQPAPAPPRLDPHQKVPVVIAQQDSCKSTITIAYEAGRNPKFTGKVGSDARTCRRARDVTVKKVKRGADPTVGKATTDAKGKYVVPARRANGRFYAKVSRATAQNDGQTITCGAARSETIRP